MSLHCLITEILISRQRLRSFKTVLALLKQITFVLDLEPVISNLISNGLDYFSIQCFHAAVMY